MGSETLLRLPDFIIGGAPRSGTTWLYHLLDRHPDIHMARPVRPEPKFFLVDELYERGLSYYADTWFAGISEDQRLGEKSTNYLESEKAAKRIHHDLPGARLIFVLREPSDRALSNWRWSRQNGLEALPFGEALKREAEREADYPPEQRYSRPFSYFARGLYKRMLQPYVDRFGLDRIQVLRYEDISRDPYSLARSAHHFLDLSEREEDVSGLEMINPSVGTETVDDETIAELRRSYERPNRELAELLGARFEIWETE